MVAPKACTGFEFGAAGGLSVGSGGNRVFDLFNGTPTVTSSTPRTGSFCLELNPSAATENAGWSTSTFGASQNRVVLGFAIRFPTSLPSGDCIVAVLDLAATASGTLQFRNSDDKLVASADGVLANGQAGPTVVADTWYYVELAFDVSGTTHTLDWWVDGTAQTQSSLGGSSADTLSNVILGGAGSNTMTCRYDDVVVWTDTAAITTPVGTHKIQLLLPDTGGTTAQIGTANATARMVTNSAIDATHNSANILAAISEIPPLLGATASGIGQRTAGVGNACGIPMTSYTIAAGEVISGVRILLCGWAATATANQQGLRTFNGTTEDILFAAGDIGTDNSTTAPAWLCKMAVDGRFDTQAELDAMVVRWGYSNDIAPLPGAHAIYAEVAVKEAVPTTGTVAETQDNQTSTASGSATNGTLAETQADNTSTASGTVGSGDVTGSLAETQDSQTSTASGVLGYSGTLAETQADQTSATVGQLGYSGTVSRTQADQTSTATGQLGYTGTVAETQDNQTSTASGTVSGIGEITGTLAETQDSQTSAATGQLGYSGSLTETQANQTATAAGWIEITGTVAETQANQTAAAVGQLGSTGTVARTQANQTLTASGWITVTGLVAETQDNQTCTATGFVGDIPDAPPLEAVGVHGPFEATGRHGPFEADGVHDRDLAATGAHP